MRPKEIEVLKKKAVIAKNLALKLIECKHQAIPLSVCDKLEKILLDKEFKTGLNDNQELLVRYKRLYDKAINHAATSCMEKIRILFIAINHDELNTLHQFAEHQDKYPTYAAYNKYLNESVSYVQSNILSNDSLEACALVAERWIAIMKKCADQNNYEAARFIMDALQSPPVKRLNLDLLLSEQANTTLMELNNLFGIDAEIKNFPAFRKKLKTSHGMNAIPLRGMIKKDLEFLTCTRDAADDEVNVKKYNEHINQIIEDVKWAQMAQRKKSVSWSSKLWAEEDIKNNDSLYELSYKIIPLGQKVMVTTEQILSIGEIQELTIPIIFREMPTLQPTSTYKKFCFSPQGNLIEAKARLPLGSDGTANSLNN